MWEAICKEPTANRFHHIATQRQRIVRVLDEYPLFAHDWGNVVKEFITRIPCVIARIACLKLITNSSIGEPELNRAHVIWKWASFREKVFAIMTSKRMLDTLHMLVFKSLCGLFHTTTLSHHIAGHPVTRDKEEDTNSPFSINHLSVRIKRTAFLSSQCSCTGESTNSI